MKPIPVTPMMLKLKLKYIPGSYKIAAGQDQSLSLSKESL
jgi:hypothetical protein